MEYVLVGIGGALGSLTRFALGKIIAVRTHTRFPIVTFLINITGAFLLGVISTLGMNKGLYVLFGDGFLGAYTTFSTFMYEGFNLFQDNEKLNAFIYIIFSFILGIAGFIMGLAVIRLT